ncbi:MAG: plastocyanin/azurin family copper-binding protein [Methanosarcinales archaeon]
MMSLSLFKNRYPTISIPLIALVAIALMFIGTTSAATIHDVSISNFAFNPQTIIIEKGDTVRWTNFDTASHQIMLDPGQSLNYTGPILYKGDTDSFVFTKYGTFTYHCHIHPFMKGRVIVKGPTISISTDKTQYKPGDTMNVNLNITNPTTDAVNVSVKIQLELPNGKNFSFVDIKSVSLPAGFSRDIPFLSVPLPRNIPKGPYIWHAVLDDPKTGDIISHDHAKWELV